VGKYVSDHGIRAIFTFDGHGVSGHPNHQAIYRSLFACETADESKPAEIKAEKAGDAGEGRKA
jgi:LmbE family N-acetylglucosaminyl deacetylase